MNKDVKQDKGGDFGRIVNELLCQEIGKLSQVDWDQSMKTNINTHRS